MSGTLARSRRSAFSWLILMSVGVSAWLTSCGPPPRPGAIAALETTARLSAERRERRFAAFEARGALRVDGRATGRLPAVNLHLRAAHPDRVRLQAGWLLGTLGDVVLRADTLTVWIPGERMGLVLPGLADTLGVRDPSRFLVRALVAGWVAPHEAWRTAVQDSAGVRLEWDEGGEHWTLQLDAEARPRSAIMTHGAQQVSARYDRWQDAGSAAWPARIELADGEGRLRMRFDLDVLHAVKRTKRSWFELTLPDDVRRLELEELKRVVAVMRGLR